MANAPSEINKGKVVANVVSFVADSLDEGDQPDMHGMNGMITLSPSVKVLKLAGTSPPLIALATQLVCPVFDGKMYAPGVTQTQVDDTDAEEGVWLIATDQPDAAPDTVQWTARFNITGVFPQPNEVSFNVPIDGTVDLANVIAASPETGTVNVLVNASSKADLVDGVVPLSQLPEDIGGGGGGADGEDGASAYEIAVAEGFIGDEAAWLASLVGEPGVDGDDGAPGSPGADGDDGQDGLGWTSGSYNAGTGVVTFFSDDGLGFSTDDLRGADGADGIDGEGAGDMVAATYDPTSVEADAFSMGNMVETSTAKVMTDAERTKLAGIAAGAEVNAVDTVNGESGAVVLDPDDLDDASTAHKFTSAAEISKLSGIASGATANASDADLRDRASHTGTQLMSTITGLEAALTTKAEAVVVTSEQTANYTLVLSDMGRAVEMSNASARTITVPPNSSVAFTIGTVIEVARMGTGSVTIVAGSGVTIRNAAAVLTLRAQYSTVSLRKRATNEWVIAGDLG